MPTTPFRIDNRRGLPLRGDVVSPGEAAGAATPVIVICHGFKGFKDWGMFPPLGSALAAAGMTVVRFNFSGSGIGDNMMDFTELDRFAEDTISAQVDDVGDILDALQAGRLPLAAADTARLGILGHSRGGATALIRAREDPRLRCVVTWAAVSRLLRWSPRELEEWRQRGFMEFLNTRTHQRMRIHYTAVEDLQRHAARFDLPACVGGLQVPLLLVHGAEDLSVRVEEARELFAAADPSRTRLHVVPHTGHTFGAVHPWQGTTPAFDEAVRHSIQWFSTHLGAAPGGSTA